jgi:hypothetical protein
MHQVLKVLREEHRQRCRIVLAGMEGYNPGEPGGVEVGPWEVGAGILHARERRRRSEHPVHLTGHLHSANRRVGTWLDKRAEA